MSIMVRDLDVLVPDHPNVRVETKGKRQNKEPHEKILCSNLNVVFSPGKLTALIGPNGSGKTTLLEYLAGFRGGKDGNVRLFDRHLFDYSGRERAQLIAYLPQSPQLYHDLLVQDVVVLGRAPYKKYFSLWSEADYQKAREALKKVGMEDFSERRVFSLSGGELQRVFLARMLATEARVYIMDEPTTFLDIGRAFEFLQLCRFLCSEGGCVICALHDLSLISQFADEVLCLESTSDWHYGEVKKIIRPEMIRRVFGRNSYFGVF